MIYALALAGCVKRTGEPGPASAFLRRGGFRDWGVTPDPEPLLVGSLGNRALVCVLPTPSQLPSFRFAQRK